jgi:hypothetical protein
VCHCLACKRRTGSAFSFNARFAENDVAIQGRAAEFTRMGDGGGRVTSSASRLNGFMRGALGSCFMHVAQNRCALLRDMHYNFCPDCGTTIHYRIDVQPGLVAIPVGAFADPSFPPPFLSFYHETRRCQWREVRAEPLATFG